MTDPAPTPPLYPRGRVAPPAPDEPLSEAARARMARGLAHDLDALANNAPGRFASSTFESLAHAASGVAEIAATLEGPEDRGVVLLLARKLIDRAARAGGVEL